jgi:hypothetical protein
VLWRLTFDGGATRTVEAPTIFEAERKVYLGPAGWKVPPLLSAVLVESAEKQEADKRAAIKFYQENRGMFP